MAEEAERLVAGTGWLPAVLRTVEPEPEASEAVEAEDFEADAQPPEVEGPNTEAQDDRDVTELMDSDQSHYAVAAE